MVDGTGSECWLYVGQCRWWLVVSKTWSDLAWQAPLEISLGVALGFSQIWGLGYSWAPANHFLNAFQKPL